MSVKVSNLPKSKLIYHPPYTITSDILNLVAAISEAIGNLSAITDKTTELRLRRVNRIRTIHGSLAIEGNTLTEEQITAILENKPVIGLPRDIQEVKNAIATYEQFYAWQPHSEKDLLQTHKILMLGLIDEVGIYRNRSVGVVADGQVIHLAPPADRVPHLIAQLFSWLRKTDAHPLIAGAVFHYEFEFIHPFADGNGRIGRLWQSLILSQWNSLFANIPIESLVFGHQDEYYKSLQESNQSANSAPFIAFMLRMILEAIVASIPQVRPQVNPQVARLLSVIENDMDRASLQTALGLADRKSFRQNYLKPALDMGLIEMTIPEKPTSRLQKYRITGKGRMHISIGKTKSVL